MTVNVDLGFVVIIITIFITLWGSLITLSHKLTKRIDELEDKIKSSQKTTKTK
jgi:hypothetical protein